jgi:hypothetical protein
MTDLRKALANPRADHSRAVARAAWCKLLRSQKAYAAAEEILQRDQVAAAIIAKADQTVGETSGHTALATSGVSAYFSALQPYSAAARLIGAGVSMPLAERESVSFPKSSAATLTVGWIGEGLPIPVAENAFDVDEMGPERKFGVLMVVTKELIKRSSGFDTFSMLMRERAAVTLDAALFGNQAGDVTTHPGLLNGLTPEAGTGDAGSDLEILLGALADKGGSGNAAIICGAKKAATIAVRFPSFKYPVWTTKALDENTLVAIDPNAFVSSYGGIDFELSESALVHMSSVPLEILSGTGPATADPVRSAWQTGAIVMRMICDIAFVCRGGLIVSMENVAWL